MRSTPERNGTVNWIGADQVQDQGTVTSFYNRVTVPDAEVGRLHGLKLIPGMPVEVFLQTGSRTMLSYLLKPPQDGVMRAFGRAKRCIICSPRG